MNPQQFQYHPQYGWQPGAFFAQLRQRFQPQEPQPQQLMVPQGEPSMGFAPGFGLDPATAYQFHQAMAAQRQLALRDALTPEQVSGAGFGAESFGAALNAYEEEDEDEFGYEADQELDDAMEDEFNGPGRLIRRLKKVTGKKDKWKDRADNQSGIWAMKPFKNLAQNKAAKFSRKENDISARLARKVGTAGAAALAGGAAGVAMTGGPGFQYINNDAPHQAGKQITLWLYPEQVPANWTGVTSSPLVAGTVAAGQTETPEITLVSKPVQYAKYMVTGLVYCPKAISSGAALMANDLKVGGQGGLFPTDDDQDLDAYAINLDHSPGLRTSQVIDKTNAAKVKIKVVGVPNDVARFTVGLVCDIIEDAVPMGTSSISRRPGPWAG